MRYMSNDFSAVSGTNPEYGHFGYLLLNSEQGHQSQIKFQSAVGDFFCPSINDRHDFWLPVNTVDADL